MHVPEMQPYHNPITILTRQLIDFFAIPTNKEQPPSPQRFQRCAELVRFNNEDLMGMGDLSIAGGKITWIGFMQKFGMQLRDNDNDAVLPDAESIEQLLEHGKQWLYPLQTVFKLHKERYALRFQRAPIITNVLQSILEQGGSYGKVKCKEAMPTLCLTLHGQFTAPDGDKTNELHKFRAEQFYLIVRRLLDYANYRVVEKDEQNEDTLHVTVECNNHSRRGTSEEALKQIHLTCAPVLEPTKKKCTALTSSSYMALRSNDMLLIAMHRNGVRDCGKGPDFEALMKRLGHAAVIVDMFEVRHGTAATVVRNGLGSSKGGNYILYNSARLETLLRNFEDRVNGGVYEPLPSLDTIDLSVLEDELDWQLIYGYLFSFPELAESTMWQLQQGQCGVHLLVRYIINLATLFSRYYRNKQILVQKRTNLMPVLYARIYLVKAVRQVLNSALALLGIQPVDYM